jgi:hypothetical protein
MTQVRLGAKGAITVPRPICIDISIRANTLAFPQSIDDCMNYQPICRWVVEDWPTLEPVPQLSGRMRELVEFIFDHDARIDWVDVTFSKCDSAGVYAAVIGMAQSRHDFLVGRSDGRSGMSPFKLARLRRLDGVPGLAGN